MTDEKRIRGEEDHVITPAEIRGWKKGSQDALKNKLLKITNTISVDKAIRIIKMFARLGDIHYVATKLDINAADARRILSTFGVNSIEDARAIVREGVVADYDDATTLERENQETQNRVNQIEGQRRLDEQVESLNPTKKPQEELDRIIADRQAEAQSKNKSDQIRALIAEGIDPVTGRSNFQINIKDLAEFKSLIPHGIGQLRRRFGGSQKDIISEVRRLAPEFNVDMLRP